MNAIDLTSNDAFLPTVELNSKTGTTNRLVTKKEFKEAHPDLKGNALTRAYNQHIKDNGKAMSSASVAYINQSGLLLKSVRSTKNTVNMSFMKPESLKEGRRRGRTITTSQIKETISSLSEADKAALLDELKN